MPFPWKNTKVSRISRFVADFQSPPKRGGSFVVETGFPTSLVDLFVKYRGRLKKQSEEKSTLEPQMEISRPMNVTPLPPCYVNRKVSSSSGSEECLRSNKIKRAPVEKLVVVEDCAGVGDGDRDGDVGGSKKMRVLMEVLRVFLVVVLALWWKELAVGITKSAFLRFFLEFVGACVLFYIGPRSKVRTVFDCIAERFKLRFCNSKEDVDASSSEDSKRFDKNSTMGSSDHGVSKKSFEGIEVVDRKIVGVTPADEIKTGRKNLKVESCERRKKGLELARNERTVGEIGNKNEDKVDDVNVSKKEQSRRAKIRASLKKIIPKKLYKRKEKKGKGTEMDSGSQVSSCASEGKLAEHRNGDRQEHCVQEEQYESVKDVGRSQGDDESSGLTVEESARRPGKRNSGCIILFLIALAGLVGGRVLALVLTVSWCLVVSKLRPAKISC